MREEQPDASSAEADAIFSAVEKLIVDDGTEAAKKHAVALATVAVTLPHGERDDIVDVLIQTAERGPRQVLLTNLVRSGQMIDVEVVKGGLDEVLEAAEKEPWLLNEGGEFFNWLMLIPFTNGLSETIAIV